MTLLEHLRRMARNNLWSNDRVYRAVLALQPGEFEAGRVGFFPSIRETLNHILAVDLLYLDFLTGGGLGAAAYDDFAPFGDAASLVAAQADFDRKLVAFCDGLSEADLDRRVITDRRDDGLILGEVELLEPPDPTPLPPRHEPLLALLRRFIERFGAMQLPNPLRLEDAAWVGCRLAELLPVTPERQQALLETGDPLLRLEQIEQLLLELGQARQE